MTADQQFLANMAILMCGPAVLAIAKAAEWLGKRRAELARRKTQAKT